MKTKEKLTAREAANEKKLKQDIQSLIKSVQVVLNAQYLKTLPYYKCKLGDIEELLQQLNDEAKEGFATANRGRG